MRYLLAIWDGGGTVPAELGIARRLVGRGHQVTVLADPSVRDDVAAAGAAFRSWTRAPHRATSRIEDDLFRDWECTNPVQLLGRLRERLVTGPAARFAADVREALTEQPADAAVVSGPLLGALAGAESMRVPTAALCANIYNRPTEGLPAFGSGLRPPRGPLGRARNAAVNALAAGLWNRGLPALNAARAELGLDPLDDIWAQWDRAERVLVLTSSAFDFPAALPGNVRYTGPVLDDPAWVGTYSPPAGAEPLVVVGMSSTYMRQDDVLRRVVAALDRLPVRAVVTTGPSVDPAAIAGTEKVHVVRAAPHAQLFPQAAAVVTHAGHGTLLKALAAGVPVVCLPMGRDQADNVVRAERYGAVVGLKKSASAEGIARAVQRVLDDPAYRDGAQRLGAQIRADAESSALVDELEALARHGSAAAA